MKIKLLISLLLCSLCSESQTIDKDLFIQLHNLTNSQMLSTTNNVAPGSLIFNTSEKSVYTFDGDSWLKLTANIGKSLIDVLSSPASTYPFQPTNLNYFYTLNTCIPPIVYQVKEGDIIELNLLLSSDFSSYNDIGEIVRFHVLLDGLSIGDNLFSGVFVGGDNHYETSHASLSQTFKVSSSGELSVGIKIKAFASVSRIYNPNYENKGGLQMKIYR